MAKNFRGHSRVFGPSDRELCKELGMPMTGVPYVVDARSLQRPCDYCASEVPPRCFAVAGFIGERFCTPVCGRAYANEKNAREIAADRMNRHDAEFGD